MLTHLDNSSSTGSAFIGMVVAAVLYGISCVQAFYYYTTQNDRWYTKLIVTVVMIFDTVHQALITHTVYTHTITDWGDSAQLETIIWSLVAAVIFTGITAFIVQSFLTMRIWRLSGNNYLTGIPAILAAANFLTLIVSVGKVFKLKNSAELIKTKGFTIAITLLNTVIDLLIAATLCTLLNTSRTGLHKSEVIINRLIVFTVNTGLITSLCALGAFISIIASGNTIYIALLFCLGRLYTNTLFATFNAREAIRNVDEAWTTDISFQLREFQKNVPNQTPNLSIKIDKTTETYHPGNDQKPEENPGLSYDEESTKVWSTRRNTWKLPIY